MAILFSTLRNQVRQRLNIENDTNITDSELDSYLNSSLAELYELIIEANEEYSLKRISFTVDASQDGYTLPDDFWKPLRIDRQIDGNNSYTLTRINIRDENLWAPALTYLYQTVTAYSTEVNTVGQTILRIFPQSQQAGVYKVLYYPAYQDVDGYVDGYVNLGVPPGMHLEEYAIIDTCIKCCLKDETEPSGFMAQKAIMLNRIKSACASRDAGQNMPPPQTRPKWYERGDAGGW